MCLYGRLKNCRETNHDAKSNNSNSDKAGNRRRSVLPVSELHLEVPCVPLRLAAVPSAAAAQVGESSLRAGGEEDKTDVSVDQLHHQVSTTLSGTTRSDEDGEVGAGDPADADVVGELSAASSRTASLTESEHSAAGENTTSGFGLVDSTALTSRQTSTNDARSELQQLRSFAVPDVPSSVSGVESTAGRGTTGSRKSVGGVRGGRGQLLPSSAPQPSSAK